MPNVKTPLSLPEEDMKTIREAAAATSMSQQDVLRQAVKLGLPVFQRRHDLVTPNLLELIRGALPPDLQAKDRAPLKRRAKRP